MKLELRLTVGEQTSSVFASGRGLACIIGAGYKGYGDATSVPVDPTYLLYIAGGTAVIDGWEVAGATRNSLLRFAEGAIHGVPSTAVTMGVGYAIGWMSGKALQHFS